MDSKNSADRLESQKVEEEIERFLKDWHIRLTQTLRDAMRRRHMNEGDRSANAMVSFEGDANGSPESSSRPGDGKPKPPTWRQVSDALKRGSR